MTEPKILEEKVVQNLGSAKYIVAKLKFPDGKEAEWDYIDFRNEVVIIVPVDEEGNTYLVKEWRLSWKKHILQPPGGACNITDEEGRIKQARNELMEEVGFDCKNIVKLCPPMIHPRIKIKYHIYLATGLFESTKEKDEHEYIEVIKMPLDKAIELFSTTEESGPTTLSALLLARKKIKGDLNG